jgi:hypothetical protein
MSLSRGPALILGTILLIAGLFFLYRVHLFPRLSQFPSAHAHTGGKAFFGIFGLNGWSGELTAAAGGLLLFGAAEHYLAKTTSLIVAIVLGGVAIWALVDHYSALGLFATNIWTVVLWLAAAVLLLLNTGLPRRRRVVREEPVGTAVGSGVAPAAVGSGVAPRTANSGVAATATTGEPGTGAVATQPAGGSAISPTTGAAAPTRGEAETGRMRGGRRSATDTATLRGGRRPLRRGPSTGNAVSSQDATATRGGQSQMGTPAEPPQDNLED